MLFEQILKRISGGLALQTSQFHQIIQIPALIKQNNNFLIGWMEVAPAVEVVLQSFSCGCRERYSAKDCAFTIYDLNTLE